MSINRMVNGKRIRMGIARFFIKAFPFSIKVAAESFSIDRLSENPVPQNTPDTNINKNKLINWIIEIEFILQT